MDAVLPKGEGFNLLLPFLVKIFTVCLKIFNQTVNTMNIVDKFYKGGKRCHVIEVLFAVNADAKI